MSDVGRQDNKIGTTAEITDSIDKSHSSDTTNLRAKRRKTGVFTFDDNIMSSDSPSRNIFIGPSRRNHSPKSPDSTTSSEGRPIPPRIGDPKYVGSRDRDRYYMNNDMTLPGTAPNDFSVRPRPLERTNPLSNYAELDFSPGNKNRPNVTRPKEAAVVIAGRPSSEQLNYATLDLTALMDNKKRVRKTVQCASSIEYAQIDMVFTKALSKTAMERKNALNREDSQVNSLKRSESSKKTSFRLLSGISSSRKSALGSFRDRKGSTSTTSEERYL